MEVSVIYSYDALRQLKKLPLALAKRIVSKVGDNANQADPLSRAKALQGRLLGKYRYRIGDYRAIFSISDDGQVTVLMILDIRHRKDSYK
jgi:mRNA interferase RelE/StbE